MWRPTTLQSKRSLTDWPKFDNASCEGNCRNNDWRKGKKLLDPIPLSASTVKRRISDMSNDDLEQTVTQVNASPFYTIQLDECTDIAGLPQLLVFLIVMMDFSAIILYLGRIALEFVPIVQPVMALIGCKRCGRNRPKIDQKVAPLHKKLLYFYEGALGCRWHVKKNFFFLKNVSVTPVIDDIVHTLAQGSATFSTQCASF